MKSLCGLPQRLNLFVSGSRFKAIADWDEDISLCKANESLVLLELCVAVKCEANFTAIHEAKRRMGGVVLHDCEKAPASE